MTVLAPKSTARLHFILVKTAFGAPMSYFESVDSSILLNTFSQDMTLVELALPTATWLVFLCESPPTGFSNLCILLTIP
jgi:ATP-binding cassette subfamily C (CFTR/MRP) protein 1